MSKLCLMENLQKKTTTTKYKNLNTTKWVIIGDETVNIKFDIKAARHHNFCFMNPMGFPSAELS